MREVSGLLMLMTGLIGATPIDASAPQSDARTFGVVTPATTPAAASMEVRVLSFEIVGLGASRIPVFARLSCLVTVRKRGL